MGKVGNAHPTFCDRTGSKVSVMAVQASQLKVRKLSVKDYHRMAEVGVLHPEERVELIDGELIEMSPIGRRHAAYVNRLLRFFVETFPATQAVVSVQNPIVLNDFSEPQPDLALLQPPEETYLDRLPQAADVLLVVEVGDRSLESDRSEKLPRYAAAGIPEVWLVDANANQIEVYRYPQTERYTDTQVLQTNDVVALVAFPNLDIDTNTFLVQS